MKRLHYLSGIVITVFIAFHFFNHVCSIFGADVHIEVMNSLRSFYRNVLIETILLSAVITQIFSGYTLFKNRRKTAITTIDKLHIWSGLYLAIFLLIHVSAVLTGRFFLNLDTNF